MLHDNVYWRRHTAERYRFKHCNNFINSHFILRFWSVKVPKFVSALWWNSTLKTPGEGIKIAYMCLGKNWSWRNLLHHGVITKRHPAIDIWYHEQWNSQPKSWDCFRLPWRWSWCNPWEPWARSPLCSVASRFPGRGRSGSFHPDHSCVTCR